LSSVPERPGAAPSRRGLGRGLEVLVGGGGTPELLHLPLEAIHPSPRQPRRRFEPEATAGLAASIRLQGVLQPVVVRSRAAGGYELIAGERRWRAAREAGVATLPALVRDADDRETLLLGLVENVAREDLSPVEEARAYASLMDEFELSLAEVAERVGRSKPSVSNRVRLLELPEEVLWMLARGDLTEGHARAVLALPDDDARVRLARKIARDGMTVRAAEKAAREGGARRKPRKTAAVDPALAARALAAMEQLTGRTVRVRRAALEVEFRDETGLAELAEALEQALE
jgi:ParB family chromosome partitioning protein